MKSIDEEISALNRSDLLPRAKALYLALMELADRGAKCKAILASLVFKSGMSESTVIRATKELEAAGFIATTRFAKIGPNTLPNIYSLIHRTAQSGQIDSTCPVKLTSKNTITNKEDSTTNNACHHDTRGEAPSVMNDRLNEYKNMLTILKKHDDFIDIETESEAYDVVELIGLKGLESELRRRRPSPIQKDEYPTSLLKDLQDIAWEINNAYRFPEEVA